MAGYDSPFSLEKSDTITLHTNSKPQMIEGQAAVPLFDDSGKYWFAQTPEAGVKVPDNGVQIKVTDQRGTSMDIHVTQN